MRIILHLILIVVFLLSGISGLPACYATKLDCEKKNTTSCPFSSSAINQEDETLPPCHILAKNTEKSPVEASVPLERYKRLKIEQIQHNPIELPPFIPSFSTTIVLETNNTNPVRHRITGEISNPHHHPPPLFIQYQSFLI
jgi:hypothetical protein